MKGKLTVHVTPDVGGFAEDKDRARQLRTEQLMPALEAGGSVILDFSGVEYSTQSFIHALVGEPLKRFGDKGLELLEFRNCSAPLRELIGVVVDYSVGELQSPREEPTKSTEMSKRR